MKIADFEKLKKLMALTTSDNDSEALAAMRKANEVVKRSDTTWPNILNRVIKIEAEVEPGPDLTPQMANAADIDRWFEVVEGKKIGGGFARFLADIKRQWYDDHWLSKAQVAALKGAAER